MRARPDSAWPGSTGPKVALATCRELPQGDADTCLLLTDLLSRGVDARMATWDDPTVDWSAFALTVVRCCWDYALRRDEFLAWAARVPRIANPADVLRWNTDKRYLSALATQGIDVVPTVWLAPGEARNFFEQGCDSGQWVVKPTVSLASLDTGRYDLGLHSHRQLASAHLRRLHDAGRTAMLQPYMRGIDQGGETSLVFIGGAFSHAVRKRAVLDGPDTGVDRRFMASTVLGYTTCEPTPAQIALAEQALACVPGGDGLLYARVDLVPGRHGTPLVMEIELTEPQLYFALAPAAAEQLARAIQHRTEAGQPRVAST